MAPTHLDVLREHGFETGHPDPGVRRTRTVERFQLAWAMDFKSPLKVDGILGRKTMAAMRSLPMLAPHFNVFEVWDWREHDCGIRREILWALESLRAVVGRPLVISSGYRTLSSNTVVGGASQSLHMQGLAVDLTTPVLLAQARATKGFSGIGVRWKGSKAFALHVDVRHALGDDSPTPGATPSRPARWSY